MHEPPGHHEQDSAELAVFDSAQDPSLLWNTLRISEHFRHDINILNFLNSTKKLKENTQKIYYNSSCHMIKEN